MVMAKYPQVSPFPKKLPMQQERKPSCDQFSRSSYSKILPLFHISIRTSAAASSTHEPPTTDSDGISSSHEASLNVCLSYSSRAETSDPCFQLKDVQVNQGTSSICDPFSDKGCAIPTKEEFNVSCVSSPGKGFLVGSLSTAIPVQMKDVQTQAPKESLPAPIPAIRPLVKIDLPAQGKEASGGASSEVPSSSTGNNADVQYSTSSDILLAGQSRAAYGDDGKAEAKHEFEVMRQDNQRLQFAEESGSYGIDIFL